MRRSSGSKFALHETCLGVVVVNLLDWQLFHRPILVQCSETSRVAQCNCCQRLRVGHLIDTQSAPESPEWLAQVANSSLLGWRLEDVRVERTGKRKFDNRNAAFQLRSIGGCQLLVFVVVVLLLLLVHFKSF